VFSLAQVLEVRLNEAKPVTGGLLFGLAESLAPAARPRLAKSGADKARPGKTKPGNAKRDRTKTEPKQKQKRRR
jgi:ribonuclease R